MHWRRKEQPTPVLLPGKSYGQRNLAGYTPRGPKINTQHIHALTGLISLLSKRFSGVFSSTTDQRHLIFAHQRRSNQSILRELNPEYSLESLMLKLKLQFFLSTDANSWLIGKVPDAGKDWRQKEKGMTDDEMVGWHHRCNGYELGQTSANDEGQGGLASCSSCLHKEADTTGWHNNDITCIYKCMHIVYIYVILCIFKYLKINFKNILSHLSSNFSIHSYFLISVFTIFLLLNNRTLFQFASWNSRNWFFIY